MSRWIRSTKDPAWRELFAGFERSAYRLEAQQTYSNDSEDGAVARFLAGQPHGLTFEWSLGRKRTSAAAGHRQDTVRVVVEPPTDYTRWELSVYPEFDEAGEKIRIIAVAEGEWPDGVPTQDYWMFDDRDVWRMHYHDNYRFAGAELLEDPAAVADHLRWRDTALAHSVPVADYLAAHPDHARPPAYTKPAHVQERP